MVATKAPQRLSYARSPSTPPAPGPTIDDDSSGGAAATSHDVLGHAGVVGRVGQAGLSHHQAMLPCDVHVGVHGWVHEVLVPEPLHLGEGAMPLHCLNVLALPRASVAPGWGGSAWRAGQGRAETWEHCPPGVAPQPCSPRLGGCPPVGGRAARCPAPATPPWPGAPAQSSSANLGAEQKRPPG